MDWPADSDLVFVPARPASSEPAGPMTPAVELRRRRDTGEPVGLAFTSVDTLVAVLGSWQPWISVPMFSYVAFLRAQGVSRVEIDPVYHDDVRDWSAERLVRAAEAL